MIVSINQPAYLPWLGYFHRIAVSDLHIVLDDVQFEKNSFTNRNKLRMKQGWCWLTVPLKTKGRFGELINQLEIANDQKWANKHLNTIRMNYAKAPYFKEHIGFFVETYSHDWHYLSDLIHKTTNHILGTLQIRTPLRRSSEMKVGGRKDELVLNLCRAVGADVYLSGPLGRNYIREKIFQDAGIRVIYQNYIHPVYRQLHPGFEAHMSTVDLIFNHGPRSYEIMTAGQGKIV